MYELNNHFLHSHDLTSTTDIGLVCKLVEEFEARNIVVVGIGMDTGEKSCLI